MKTRFLIIGAGPTGLGAGYRLKELGAKDFLIVDAADHVGGLARSVCDPQGFTWDMGGHIQFSHYEYFDRLMETALPRSEWNSHERESWVWLEGRFVPYPFQNNLRYLSKESTWKCLQGLLRANKAQAARDASERPKTFAEWVQWTFGDGVAQIFMQPYNFKVWAHPLEMMMYEWIGERVSVPDFERLLSNVILGKDDVSWGPNATFQFPKKGGTGAIWDRVGDLVGRERIHLKDALVSLSMKTKTAKFASGREITFEKCLNTSPLDLFTGMISDLGEKTKRRASELKHSSTHVVGLGLIGQIPAHLHKKCWMYFPENDNPFYRATVFSHYSVLNVPKPKEQWSLMLEISESKHKPVDVKKIIEETVQGCIRTHLILPSTPIVSKFHCRLEYGYPTPSVEREAILKAVHPELEAYDVFSRGRFGGWRYEVSNQDHSVMQGVEWAEAMMAQGTEETYFCRRGLGPKEPLQRKAA